MSRGYICTHRNGKRENGPTTLLENVGVIGDKTDNKIALTFRVCEGLTEVFAKCLAHICKFKAQLILLHPHSRELFPPPPSR
jgi:hypothetical protein